jgi:hypothetical protein
VAAVRFAADSLGASWHAHLGSAQAIQLLHATGDLAAVARSGRYVRKAVAKLQVESTITSGGDVSESPLWLVCVFRVLLGVSKTSQLRVQIPWATTADGVALREALLLLGARSWSESSKREVLVAGTDDDRLARLSASHPGSTIILRHAMLSGSVHAAAIRLSKFPLFDPKVNRWFEKIFPADDTQFHGIDRKELKNQLSLFANQGKPYKNLTLRQIDDAVGRWTDSSVVLSPGARQALGILIRGINPEFQAPAAIALAEIVTNPSRARALAQVVWRLAPVRPVELRPNHLSTALLVGGRSWLAQVVDLLDRSGRLGRLLMEARKIAPRASKLRTVALAYAKWDDLLWSCWRSKGG